MVASSFGNQDFAKQHLNGVSMSVWCPFQPLVMQVKQSTHHGRNPVFSWKITQFFPFLRLLGNPVYVIIQPRPFIRVTLLLPCSIIFTSKFENSFCYTLLKCLVETVLCFKNC